MMPDLIDILKIVVIACALIALRIVIQALIKHGGGGNFLERVPLFAMPPLLTGGPMFIALPAGLYAVQSESVPNAFFLMALGGGLGLTFGLLVMFTMLIAQRRQIERLQELISGESGAPAAD